MADAAPDPEPDLPDAGADAEVIPVGQLGYAEAMAELEAILAEIDDDEVGVDRLATRMRRAAALIAHCRARIGDAEVEVERIVADLTALDPAEADEVDEVDGDGGGGGDDGSDDLG